MTLHVVMTVEAYWLVRIDRIPGSYVADVSFLSRND